MNVIEFKNIEDKLHSTLYPEYFSLDSDGFNDPLVTEIEGVYTRIISEITKITVDQGNVLRNIFDKFIYIQKIIDPNRLKEFSVIISEDDDIILYRNTDEELINLVIHPEDDFVLSIINKVEGNSINYFDNNSVDFEKVAYTFMR